MLRAVLALDHGQPFPGEVGTKGRRVERDVTAGYPPHVAAGTQGRAHGEIARTGQQHGDGDLIRIGGQHPAQRPGDGTEEAHYSHLTAFLAASRHEATASSRVGSWR